MPEQGGEDLRGHHILNHMRKKQGSILVLMALLFMASGCSLEKAYMMRQKRRVYPLEQVDFQFMVDRYVNKAQTSVGTIEGIYSVSSVVIKKGKSFTGQEKEKIKDQEEHYSKVAIIRDDRSADREYIEVSLNKQYMPTYSVIGEFKELAESSLLMYKHFESRGRSTSFTFSYDKAKDILEGVRTENSNNSTVTYKLTYVKLEPKATRNLNY
jgi:hypothetical protein